MKLTIYTVRDKVAGDSSLILTAVNTGMLLRNVKAVLLSDKQNFLNTDTSDKDIFESGHLETDTGVIKGYDNPVFIVNIEQLRLELVAEYNRRKAQIADGGVSDGEHSND